MHDNPSARSYQTYEEHHPYGRGPGGRRSGPLGTLLTWVIFAMVALLALAALGWILGLVFHVAALLIKVALATAVIAFVWRTVAGRRTPKSPM
ncbi:MAG: hypothetical protein KGQ66_02475 [Acidobacteriota bacterium]|nr:hypothetical protein [Acidobacteriota bacterium]